MRSFWDLDGQRFWQGNMRRVDWGGQDDVSVIDGAVRALHRPRVCIRVPFYALDLDANPSKTALHH